MDFARRTRGCFSFQDTLKQKIMNELIRWQKAKTKEGSEKRGRPKKKIYFDTFEKQLSAGVSFTAIAASRR
jgi:hypothetical protein